LLRAELDAEGNITAVWTLEDPPVATCGHRDRSLSDAADPSSLCLGRVELINGCGRTRLISKTVRHLFPELGRPRELSSLEMTVILILYGAPSKLIDFLRNYCPDLEEGPSPFLCARELANELLTAEQRSRRLFKPPAPFVDGFTGFSGGPL
jgi:hypothetical protein